MTFEEGLYNGLKSIVSNRIYPMTAPQDSEVPYMIYSLGQTVRPNELDGFRNLIEQQFQLDTFHTNYGSLKSIHSSIISTLKTFNNSTVGVYVQEITIDTEAISYEPSVEKHRGTIEFTVHYEEV